ncbi:T9SS type A sorting domain-containing protein [Aquimarina litoralis]|uniref:T9SS type A sorting domain-containing protein n=1 Tax=Aquimarina litoralis TaxID=584605 RepID=UPI001C56CA6A|nr:T9SS type A sorting domain-containing protein [Aquimarina litoralis]MBW1294174.1 T9SS type A sorting domain-containing protein [Aquimarina litoralis]
MKKITFLILCYFFIFEVFAQNVNIPDANFKAYLVGNASINTNGDTEIQVSEATAFTGHINCPSLNIASLTGIEAFVNLSELSCYSNSLTTLNLEQNTALTFLRAEHNQIANLILNRNNSLLWYINVTSNQLTSFNPWEHPLLEILFVRFNQLTTIDTSQNTLLRILGCGSNLLTNLNVSQNPALEYLYFDNNQIATINLSQNAALEYISCTNNVLTNLDFSQNLVLNEVVCWNNQLTSINVTQNTVLTKLNCHGNLLTSINVSQNIALQELFCEVNPITSLDVSQNTALVKLGCYTSQLTSLNVQNGNNTNFTYYNSNYNPNLVCILVDNANYSVANWTGVDPASTFVDNLPACNTLSTPSYVIDNNLNIYPNPSSSYINIDYTDEIKTINLYNAFGQKVTETDKRTLDVQGLKSGIYFLNLDLKEVTIVKKIIVK